MQGAAVVSSPAGGLGAQQVCPPLGALNPSYLAFSVCRIIMWPLRLLKNGQKGPAWAHPSVEQVVLQRGQMGWGCRSAHALGTRVTQAADAVSAKAVEGVASAFAGAASNVIDLMTWLSNTKALAKAANKVVLEAEQAKDALERDVQDLERAVKRKQTEASSTKNAEDMKVDVDMCDFFEYIYNSFKEFLEFVS